VGGGFGAMGFNNQNLQNNQLYQRLKYECQSIESKQGKIKGQWDSSIDKI
jgi:hypothetical protein